MIVFGVSASAGVSSEATPDEAETISVQIIDKPNTATPDEAPTETVTQKSTKPTEPQFLTLKPEALEPVICL